MFQKTDDQIKPDECDGVYFYRQSWRSGGRGIPGTVCLSLFGTFQTNERPCLKTSKQHHSLNKTPKQTKKIRVVVLVTQQQTSSSSHHMCMHTHVFLLHTQFYTVTLYCVRHLSVHRCWYCLGIQKPMPFRDGEMSAFLPFSLKKKNKFNDLKSQIARSLDSSSHVCNFTFSSCHIEKVNKNRYDSF